MAQTVKSDDQILVIQYDTMAELMTDVAAQNVAGFEMVNFSAVALTVTYKKAL